ncbi:hypothetical protein N665_3190s0001 [Sinapis alba]|nr:hypothetical protein N665_3190s0001 [Sinapis alba]
MADQCMVLAGEWKTGDDGSWTFSIDKLQMSHIVPLSPTMTLQELKNYWPPNTKELVTGITTPPVMLTHDGSVLFFYRHFEAHKGMNLFVTFKTKPEPVLPSQVSENLFQFTTPNQPILKPKNLSTMFNASRDPASYPSPPSTAASRVPGFSLFDDEDFLDDISLTAASIPHTGPSKINRFSIIDETVSCGDEMLEEMFKDDPDNIPDSWKSEEEEEDVTETPIPPDFEDVQPVGYDHEFWDPLIDNDLGGSDAPEVMAGIHVPKTAPHVIHCTTGDAFDHTVLVCSCQVFQKLKIPCGHALLAADYIGLPYVQLFGDCYKSQSWIDSYAGVVSPEAPDGDHPIPESITSFTMHPPQTRRPSGRPKDKRIASTGKLPPMKKKKLVPNKCGRCGGTGHNRTNCIVSI